MSSSISLGLTRREALRLLSMGGVGALLSNNNYSSEKSTRPNIIFILSDDHAYDELGCAGNSLIETPSMDRLAREGVRFENAFCTNALCAPSRATDLTGCFSNVHGIMGNSEAKGKEEHMDPSVPTFPQLLQKAGYQTGLVGKWHLPQKPRGFDHYSILPGQGVYFDPEFIENGTHKQHKGYVTDIITDMAIDYLNNVSEDKPFCLLYQHKAPHRPFKPAPRNRSMYEGIDFPYPETFYDDYSTRMVAKEAKDMRIEESLAGDYEDLPPGLTTRKKKEWIYQRFAKDRYRTIHSIDEGLGRVLDLLDQRGLAKQTFVIYTSDHGFFVGEHGWYDKRFMYEPSHRIPLLIRYPEGFEAKSNEERMVMNVDLAPTILDFAGLSIPPIMQGRSLKPLLTDWLANWRNSVYYSYYDNTWALRNASRKDLAVNPSFNYFTAHRVGPNRGIRTDRYKLIEYYSKSNYWELFDLKNDPYELNNLYYKSSSQNSKVIEELTHQLRRSQKKYGDTETWNQLVRPDYKS